MFKTSITGNPDLWRNQLWLHYLNTLHLKFEMDQTFAAETRSGNEKNVSDPTNVEETTESESEQVHALTVALTKHTMQPFKEHKFGTSYYELMQYF